MEDILASIKRVIAEDAKPPVARNLRPKPDVDLPAEDNVLELDTPVQADASLMSEDAAEASRNSLAALSSLKAASPLSAPQAADDAPLEAVVRDMLRPMLKDWLDQRLPAIVQEIVAKEVARITGKS